MPSESDKLRRILIVAFHFPPQVGSSAALRMISFCRYLPESGWTPTVLTAKPHLYPATDPSQLKQIPPSTQTIRVTGFDALRQLSIKGRYFRWTAMPDRWVSWALRAVPKAISAIKRDRKSILLTTYPIASTVLLGLIVHKWTGVPWVLDLRDPMTDEGYPPDPSTRRVFLWLERKAISRADRILFTAEAARETYLQRFPSLRAEQCITITNGYEESDFAGIAVSDPAPINGRPLRLLHSGIIYPEERDPRPFLRALGRLKRSATIDESVLQVDLRASGHDEFLRAQIAEAGVENIVRLLPSLPYHESLQDAASADALLLMQAAWCDAQIPAKAYEYLRLGKPILALTSHAGETARLMKRTGGATILDLADEDAIASGLPRFCQSVRTCEHPIATAEMVASFNRQSQAKRLAEILNGLVQEHSK